MIDERKEGVNLLNPEVGSMERESNFEAQEARPEQAPRQDETPRVDRQQVANVKATITKQVQAPAAPQKDPVLVQLESILSENLADIYMQLPEDRKKAFKDKGEEVAGKIHEMVVTAKVKVHLVLKLIGEWLGMIPNVNVYFLKQEAKIKLDKVMDYAEERSKNANNSL